MAVESDTERAIFFDSDDFASSATFTDVSAGTSSTVKGIFDKESVESTLTALKEAEVNESIMIDASHGNSQKKFKQQIPVIDSICEQISDGNKNIKGVMIESHLNEGNQKITEKLNYGQSITDACIDIQTTAILFEELANVIDQ